jgi:hypothetical protein
MTPMSATEDMPPVACGAAEGAGVGLEDGVIDACATMGLGRIDVLFVTVALLEAVLGKGGDDVDITGTDELERIIVLLLR